VPFVAMLVYAYHLTALYEPFGTLKAATLSIATFSLLILSLAVAASCPESGWMRHIAGSGPGSVVLRRVLPAFIGVPMLMGMLSLIERVTVTTLAASIGVVLLGLTLLEAVLIFRSGLTINDLDAARSEAQAELAERAEALRSSNDQLRAIDRLKTDFVNTVSHELRTPLTSIRGYAEFLEDEIAGPIGPENQAYVSEIQVNTHRLQRLVDDLLDFAKLEAGTFRLAPSRSDLTAIAREVASSLQPVASRAGVALRFEAEPGPLSLVIDAGRIEQVVLNLVGNALKFTPPGGAVVIRVIRREGEAWVGIADTGIGITPEAQAKLFDKFFQVDNTSTRERGGAGLGLAISKALVEAHGGAIGVDSAPGHGSTFWFTLPLREASAPLTERPSRSTGA
jgi:signal transduction histidine kinase